MDRHDQAEKRREAITAHPMPIVGEDKSCFALNFKVKSPNKQCQQHLRTC